MNTDKTIRALASRIRLLTQQVADGNPEDPLKPLVGAVIESAGQKVVAVPETVIAEGRPDLGVTHNRTLVGFVELKAPGKGADPTRFKGHDKAQWERFQALPNLIYTDGQDWALFRTGKRVARFRFAGDFADDGGAGIAGGDLKRLADLLTDFLAWEPIVPSTPKGLAETLAPLCRLLRAQVLDALAIENSNVRAIATKWRELLFPDADDAQFADAYAQTVTYALLLARLDGLASVKVDEAVKRIETGHALLANILEVLAHRRAREEIATAVDLLERIIGSVDVVKLTRHGDPWLYFYEDFLEAYDKKLRNDRGAYYTPLQVIRCQLRLVAELLRTRFNKPLLLADEGVIFLDPAAGTGTYPLAALEMTRELVEKTRGKGAVAGKADTCVNNLYAFEIMVGPYAVAHLRLTQALRSMGANLTRTPVNVYLTDTLDSPDAPPPLSASGALFVKAMTEEHRRAQMVKRDTPVLVCLGNPPYNREQRDPGEEATHGQRKGGWVRYGEGSGEQGALSTQGILQDFIAPVAEAGEGVHLKNLYNDYVYFWRWALWKLFGADGRQGRGIVSYITAASYLRGPGFGGMRKVMRQVFEELWIIDLGGEGRGARKSENVFNIQTPVCIAVGVRSGAKDPAQPAVVRYAEITGTRDEKYARLDSVEGFASLNWQTCNSGWTDTFLPVGVGDYQAWPKLTDIFPWQHSGCQAKRSWPISAQPDSLRNRWLALSASGVAQRGVLVRETRDRKVEKSYQSLIEGDDRHVSLVSLRPGADCPPITRYAYRSFDRQWILADNRLLDFPKPVLWRAHSNRQLY